MTHPDWHFQNSSEFSPWTPPKVVLGEVMLLGTWLDRNMPDHKEYSSWNHAGCSLCHAGRREPSDWPWDLGTPSPSSLPPPAVIPGGAGVSYSSPWISHFSRDPLFPLLENVIINQDIRWSEVVVECELHILYLRFFFNWILLFYSLLLFFILSFP